MKRNVGCVPKKLLVLGAHFSEENAQAIGYGWQRSSESAFDWSLFMGKKDAEISRLNGIYGNMLKGAGVDVILGRGSLQGAHEVLVEKSDGSKQVLTANNIVLCMGGWPFKPSISGAELCITSNEVFYLRQRPQRVLIVGGGFVAVEFACILQGLGSEVTLSYRGELFLRGFDDDVRKQLRDEMAARGIKLEFSSQVESVRRLGDAGSGCLEASLAVQPPGQPAAHKALPVDAVLFATGRAPRTAGLGLEAAGGELAPGGLIPVDKYSRTNVPNIFAIGDISQGKDGVLRPDLTPVALHEGHCLADTLYGGKDSPTDHAFIPSTVFSSPELATVGYTEEQAVNKFRDVTVFKTSFAPMKSKFAGRASKTVIKMLVSDKDDRVVGLHILGDSAGEMMQGFAVAIKMGATKHDFDSTIGIHPTAAEEVVTMRTPSYRYINGEKQAKM